MSVRDELRGIFDVTAINPQDPEVKEAAEAVIWKMHAAGLLRPVDGWEGGVVEGYLDVLGLNGREIRLNKSSHPGLYSSSSQAM